VPLHFINAEVSPAVKLSAGIVSHVMADLDITCLPKDLPEFIDVDLSTLEVGQSIHLADIKLPEGVTFVVHGGQDNPTIATASIPAGKVESEAEITAAADAAAAAAAAAAAPAADKGGDKGGDKK
jgi:large subunit ribosomal protein L25